MSTIDTDGIYEKNINDGPVLYELLVYKEWKLDPEQWKPVTIQTLLGDETPHSWWWNIMKINKIFNKHPWPEEELAKTAVFLLPWQIALSLDGKRVAVLQDTVLEIRASHDEYTIITGRATIPRDRRPQFRKMSWSPDSQMIAVASSDGSVRVYDFCGSLIFKIPLIAPESNIKKLITGLEFITSREKKNEWELLIIYANGSLDCYIISSIDKCMFSHHSTLSESGISCSAFSQEYGILFISVKPQNVISFEGSTLLVGLTAWRLLNEAPHYKKIYPAVDDVSILPTHWNIWRLMSRFTTEDCINKIVISPSNEYLATLHTNGSVLIWLSPILRVYSKFDRLDTKQQKVMIILGEISRSCHAMDIEWRKDNKLIVLWKTGTISIHDINSSDILTFFGPEILKGLPRVTLAASLHGILVLECETVHFVRPSVSPDISSDEERSILDTTNELIQSTMYLLTDLEKYEPKMKSVKIVQRVFRLIGVKMTTPEELFERFLLSNEFEKSFEICEEYHLDIMKVYQRQWRTSEVSDYSIQQYLNNVQDEEWVLTECLDRIPETLLGAKLLIEYSLYFTDRKSYVDELKILNELKFKTYILARLKFLVYAAKFSIFEQIIDDTTYSMDHYERFRRQSIVDSAIDFARCGHSAAIELLFTYHGNEILPYWLNILDNFPESVDPLDYRSLLPACDGDGVPVKWKCIITNETEDWAQKEYFSSDAEKLCITPQNIFDEFYSFDSEGLSHWYKKRSLNLEKLSTVVDNAVRLLQLGIDRNIEDLEEIFYEMKMLCTLVYELNLDINFDYLQKQCVLKKLQLFIQKPDDFDLNMVKYVHSAIDHYADKHSDSWFMLYRSFLINNSKNNLGPVFKYISYILCTNLDIISPERVVDILIDCIYAYEPLDLLNESENMINDTGEWLSTLSEGLTSSKKKKLFRVLLTVKNEIKTANILLKFDYGRSLSFLNGIKNDFEKSKQFIEDFTNTVIKSFPPDIDIWVAFLNDLLDVLGNCFLCIPTEYCYEIFVSHMLKSSSTALIEKSPGILCCSRSTPQRHLSFETSVRIISSAAQYYFNSSSHFNDKFMQLAKSCLMLLADDHEKIQEELDLIFAMKLFSELGVHILPIQVRQTKERIKLIDICFDRNSRAYRNPQLIYRLAFKLHVQQMLPDKSRRRCYRLITIRLAQEAFKRHDYPACAEFCNELIIESIPDAWKVCMNLAECSEYGDTQMKTRLITFSLVFAPARVLPHLFKIREELKCKETIVRLHNSLENCAQYNLFHYTNSIQWNKLKDLTLINSKQEVIQAIIELWSVLIMDEPNLQISPSDFVLISPSIHSSLHPRTYKIYQYNYFTSDINSKESTIFDVIDLFLKLILLNSDFNDDNIKEIILKVLTTCGILSSKEDSALSMCYFLCVSVISENFMIKNCFKESQLIFENELYFITLKDLCLYSSDVFSSAPVESISNFLRKPYMEANLRSFKMLIMSLKTYNQVKQVKALECGIDTVRFNEDEHYRKDTIFGLAMNEDLENLKLAIDLAKENNFSIHEVVVSHLISLLFNSSTALAERICNEEILLILHEHRDFFIERLKETLPSLNGTNYHIMISFFTIIKILKDDCCIWQLKPKEHILLLKKLKSLSKDIDYKDLLLCNDELHFILQPLMSSENVLVVGKFIKSLPTVIKNKYQIGQFFCQWAIEEFNKKCINVSFKQSVLNFVNLNKFFAKLSEEELQIFFESTILSMSTVSVMDSGLRKKLIISLMEWCHSNYNRHVVLLAFLQKNLDILNKLWDEDFEHWNPHLKNYVFLMEQNLRESNNEENIMDVFKRAILDPLVTKTDIIYLHKITQTKDNLLCTITTLLSSSNVEILEEWKQQFFVIPVDKRANISDSSYCEKILEKYKYPPCELGDYWVGILFNAFKDDYPEDHLKENLNNMQDILSFLPEVIANIIDFDKIVVIHKYLQHISDTVEYDKLFFGIELLKRLSSIDSADKYAFSRDVMSSNSIQFEDMTDAFKIDIGSRDKLLYSWCCFHSDSSEIHAVGRNVIEEEGDQIDDKFFLLPSDVIVKIIPSMVGTNFYQRFIKKSLQQNKEKLLQNCVTVLQDKGMEIEATTLLLVLNKTPKGLTSFDTALNYSLLSS